MSPNEQRTKSTYSDQKEISQSLKKSGIFEIWKKLGLIR